MALNDDDKAELTAYLDGELDEEATQAVEAKIASDPDVRAELDALKQTWGMLDYLPKANPSPNFTHRTMQRLTIEIEPAGSKTQPAPAVGFPWFSGVAWAAAILVALGVGYGATIFFWPPPATDPGPDPGANVQPAPPEPIADADLPLVRNLRIIERWRLYEHADDIDFAKKLSHPDLFGEEPREAP